MTAQNNSSGNKIYYKLTPVDGAEAFSYISKLTNGFDENSKISTEFVQNLEDNLKTQDDILSGFLRAPKNTDITKQVIGKDGCYFHKTTEETGICFIWHNRTKNSFEFWGQKKNIIDAMNRIKWRIDTVTQRVNNGKSG